MPQFRLFALSFVPENYYNVVIKLCFHRVQYGATTAPASGAWPQTWQRHGACSNWIWGLCELFQMTHLQFPWCWSDDPDAQFVQFLWHVRGYACGGLRWPLIVLMWHSALLEMWMPHPAHCFITSGLSKDFKGLNCRFPKVKTLFNVCSLFKFEVHGEIAYSHLQVVKNIHVTKVLMVM